MNLKDPAQLGLYRTDNIKHTTFYGTGYGREDYILQNGGGLRKDKESWGSQRRSGWDSCTKTDRVYCQPPPKRSQVMYYPPDGSGRDSYVIKNLPEYSKPFVDYPNEWLRENKKYPFETPIMNSRFQYPSLTSYNNWPSKQAIKQNRETFKRQKNSIGRLSPSPKFSKDPIAKQVQINRLNERARTSMRSSRENVQKFTYMKKGKALGFTPEEYDILTKPSQDNQKSIIQCYSEMIKPQEYSRQVSPQITIKTLLHKKENSRANSQLKTTQPLQNLYGDLDRLNKIKMKIHPSFVGSTMPNSTNNSVALKQNFIRSGSKSTNHGSRKPLAKTNNLWENLSFPKA